MMLTPFRVQEIGGTRSARYFARSAWNDLRNATARKPAWFLAVPQNHQVWNGRNEVTVPFHFLLLR